MILILIDKSFDQDQDQDQDHEYEYEYEYEEEDTCFDLRARPKGDYCPCA